MKKKKRTRVLRRRGVAKVDDSPPVTRAQNPLKKNTLSKSSTEGGEYVDNSTVRSSSSTSTGSISVHPLVPPLDLAKYDALRQEDLQLPSTPRLALNAKPSWYNVGTQLYLERYREYGINIGRGINGSVYMVEKLPPSPVESAENANGSGLAHANVLPKLKIFHLERRLSSPLSHSPSMRRMRTPNSPPSPPLRIASAEDLVAVKVVRPSRDFDDSSSEEVRALRTLMQLYGKEGCTGRFPLLIDYFTVHKSDEFGTPHRLPTSRASTPKTPPNAARRRSLGDLSLTPKQSKELRRKDVIDESELRANSCTSYLADCFSAFHSNSLRCIVMTHEAGFTLTDFVIHRLEQQSNAQRLAFCQHSDDPLMKRELYNAVSLAVTLSHTLETLNYVHQANIVHGDACVENIIMLAYNHRPVLVDFGDACITSKADEKVRGWAGGPLPPARDYHSTERMHVQKHAAILPHLQTRRILESTDISSLVRSFNSLLQSVEGLFGTGAVLDTDYGLKWTPNVRKLIARMILLRGADFEEDERLNAAYFAYELRKAIRADVNPQISEPRDSEDDDEGTPCYSCCPESAALRVFVFEEENDGDFEALGSACEAAPLSYGHERFYNRGSLPDAVDDEYASLIPDDCLTSTNDSIAQLPGFTNSSNTPSLFFDFRALADDLVDYRISIVSSGAYNCTFGFGCDGGAIAASVLPTCALDAQPVACGRSEEFLLEPTNNASEPMVDFYIPAGVLQPGRLYRLRVRTIDENDVGCYSACVAAHVLPREPSNVNCEDALWMGVTTTIENVADLNEFTQAPTQAPTDAPTRSPTQLPTAAPTKSPTPLPTALPTKQPTAQPTKQPTKQPTVGPTNQPTQIPTALPTSFPTPLPSAFPTPLPTAVPTALPTALPTAVPSAVPTAVPSPPTLSTATPTSLPTAFPTPLPTALPTAQPTGVPSVPPTPSPTFANETLGACCCYSADEGHLFFFCADIPQSTCNALCDAPELQLWYTGSQCLQDVCGDFYSTPVPTAAPSTSPTVSPTKLPTRSPTRSPTPSPTPLNTTAFYGACCCGPVPNPTRCVLMFNATDDLCADECVSPPSLWLGMNTQCSACLTPQPTTFPTNAPSPAPTFTLLPTRAPSTSPTKSPTRFPTQSPTRSPTRFPTASPTPSPTAPTPMPTSLLRPCCCNSFQLCSYVTSQGSCDALCGGLGEGTLHLPGDSCPSACNYPSASVSIGTCPAIGLCTTSDGDSYSVCSSASQACPAGSVPDSNVTIGSACHPNDPGQTYCRCCTRSCGANWATSGCAQHGLLTGYHTCVPAGTCSSRFYGFVDGSYSCGSGSQCECCNMQGAVMGGVDQADLYSTASFTQCGGQPNVIDTSLEICDGTDLGGETCQSIGYASGTLACHSQCYTFDTSGCVPYGACCTNKTECASPVTQAQCGSGTFIRGAVACTPNLCEIGYNAAPSPKLQDRRQPTNRGGVELGVRTSTTRQAVSTVVGSGGVCSGACYVGTVGALLYYWPNDTYYLLSNAHVWASPVGYAKDLNNCASIVPPRRDGSDKVYQTATCTLTNELHIGSLAAYTQITPASEQYADAAIATIIGAAYTVKAMQFGLGAQSGDAPPLPELGMIVIKSSRTTGFTIGQISGIGVTVNVQYYADDASDSRYLVRFRNQIMVDGLSPTTSFTEAGDSGSVVFEYGTMRAVGLNFAGGNGIGVLNPMQEVFEALFPNGVGIQMAEPPAQLRRRQAMRERGEDTSMLDEDLNKWRRQSPDSLRFMPSSSRLLNTPSAAALDRAAGAMNSLTVQSNAAPVLEEMMTNGSLAGYYIGTSRNDRTKPCLYLMNTGDENELAALKQQLPQSIDGIEVQVFHTPPFEAHNKR